MSFNFNQSVWVLFGEKKYRGYYQGPTRYGQLHWVANKQQKRKHNDSRDTQWSWGGAGWCVEVGQIFTRRRNE